MVVRPTARLPVPPPSEEEDLSRNTALSHRCTEKAALHAHLQWALGCREPWLSEHVLLAVGVSHAQESLWSWSLPPW